MKYSPFVFLAILLAPLCVSAESNSNALPELELFPGQTGTISVVADPAVEKRINIIESICKDTDGDGKCNDHLINPSPELSAYFGSEGTYSAVTDGDGRIDMTVKLGSSATPGDTYTFRACASMFECYVAEVTVGTTSIPEFPSFLLPVGLSMLGMAIALRV